MAKYKVNDTVKAKFGKEQFHILEVLVQTCEGGVQVTYLVRGYTKLENKEIWRLTTKEFRLREMELGEKVEAIGGGLSGLGPITEPQAGGAKCD